MSNLSGKRVLYIAPAFFGYEKDIQLEIVAQGGTVDYFNERVFESTLGKIIIRLNLRFLISWFIKEYYGKIVNQASSRSYDYLFVVSPETMNSAFIDDLRAVNPRIKTILYMWDSIENKKNASSLLKMFDKVCTFDRRDRASNNEVEFLPLFFSPSFDSKRTVARGGKYSVAFIGTVHSDRYKLIKNICKQVESPGRPSFTFFYCPSRALFFLKKLLTSEFNGISITEVSFTPMSKQSVFDVLKVSDIVIDVEHPSQQGLTMRTIEMLGASKKIVTTNADVVNYDFFSEKNICVIDRCNPVVTPEFVGIAYTPCPPEVVNKYSLNSWVASVFNC